ncbi:MAG: LON peptidase substrate-binding domain-containing protein, partial [Candidatus Acidiferrales bacterium]
MSKPIRVIPPELPILPVRDTVLFPGAVMPLPVGRESSLALLNSLEGTEKILGVVAQLDPRIEAPSGTDLHSVGTLAKVHKMVRMPNGNVVAFLEGIERIRVMEVLSFKPFLKARVEAQPDLEDNRDAELTALERNVQELFREVVARSPQLSDDLQTEVTGIDSPGRLADFVASTLPSLSTMIRQEQLETFSVRRRLEALINELTKEREVLD